ncbi:hypothetical protein PENSPDRAFT_460757 [Peniophora sp. CONT]|nr:hypothetical protein PENSPDRAFT_460757 [Peniophora sp. CONT]
MDETWPLERTLVTVTRPAITSLPSTSSIHSLPSPYLFQVRFPISRTRGTMHPACPKKEYSVSELASWYSVPAQWTTHFASDREKLRTTVLGCRRLPSMRNEACLHFTSTGIRAIRTGYDQFGKPTSSARFRCGPVASDAVNVIVNRGSVLWALVRVCHSLWRSCCLVRVPGITISGYPKAASTRRCNTTTHDRVVDTLRLSWSAWWVAFVSKDQDACISQDIPFAYDSLSARPLTYARSQKERLQRQATYTSLRPISLP